MSIESRKTINALEQAIMEGDNPVVLVFISGILRRNSYLVSIIIGKEYQ